MLKFFIPAWLVQQNKQRGYGGIENGELRLWDPNMMEYSTWGEVEPLPNHHGYSASRDEVPQHWDRVIRPLEEICSVQTAV